MKNTLNKIGAFVSVSAMSLLPFSVLAQLSEADAKLGEIGTKLGDSPKSLPIFIGNLINVFLSVLGIIFVVLTVYAGWLYMTDSGEGKKAEKAKKLLGTAIIGLVIVIAAYSISTFVITSLIAASKT